MMRKIVRSRVALIGWGGAYFFLFLWVYAQHIAPRFGYQGFVYVPDVTRDTLIGLLVMLPLLWMPLQITRPSVLAIWILYFLVYAPAIMVSFYILRLGFPFPSFFIWLCLSMLFLSLLPLLPPIRFPRLVVPRKYLLWGLAGMWVGGYGLFLKAFGLRHIPSLQEIYRIRLAARTTVLAEGGLFGYLLRWFANVVNPFWMALGTKKGKMLLLAVGGAGQVLIFTFDATKSTLMSVPYLLALYVVFRWKKWRPPAVFLFQGTIALFLGALLIDSVFHSYLMRTYVLRRVFYVPGLLTAFYYDYFSAHSQWHWTHTLVGRWLGLLPPEGVSVSAPGFLIGSVYFHNAAGNANVNLWADAFANFGNVGVVLVTLMLFFLLWLYDSLSHAQEPAIAFLLMGMPVFALTNTSLLTALLTHGWIPALLLLWIWPPPRRKKYHKHNL